MATYFGDLQHTAVLGQSLAPGAPLGAPGGNGLTVDMILGDANNFNAILNHGVYDITGGNSYVINIKESDDGITFVPLATPVAFNLAAGQPGFDGMSGVRCVWGMRSKRYLRAEAVVTGGSASILGASVIFIERLKTLGEGGGDYSA